ncbi:hypothetical protein A2U01_0064947, partial [Trifolium medium]|nr:hypothetical protein [Trifolium medium]
PDVGTSLAEEDQNTENVTNAKSEYESASEKEKPQDKVTKRMPLMKMLMITLSLVRARKTCLPDVSV